METYINLRMDSSYIRSIVRTRRRWLSKYTLSDKVSCIFTLVLFMVICINREVECSRLNGAFASPCYRLDGQNKPILDKPQVSNNKIKLKMFCISIFFYAENSEISCLGLISGIKLSFAQYYLLYDSYIFHLNYIVIVSNVI